jgi:hypothetical protein
MSNHHNNAAVQRQRLLAALRNRKGGMSSLEIRKELDILHHAGRIMELRKTGHNILTNWVYEPTDAGEMHRIGKYVLIKEVTSCSK